MSGGVFAVDRKVFEHECFADEPYTEREAWLWLVGEAAWKSRRVRAKGGLIEVQRGQLAVSIRFIAARWKWSKSRVHRFLARLQAEDMIRVESGTVATRITICNYDKYQKVSLPDGTTAGRLRDDRGTKSGTIAGQLSSCNKEENQDGEEPSGTIAGRSRDEKRDKTEYKEINSVPNGTAPVDDGSEVALFARGKQVLGKSAGGLIKRLKDAAGSIPEARAIIEKASGRETPREYVAAALRRLESSGPVLAPAPRYRPYDPLSGGHVEPPQPFRKPGYCTVGI